MLLRNLLFMANANIDRFCFSKNVLAHHEASLNFTTRIVSSMADQVRPQPVGDFKSNQMDPPYSVPLSTDKHLKRIPKTKRVSPIFPGLAFALTALIALQGLLWPGTAVGHPNGQPTNQVAEERGQLERRLAQASVNNLSRADRYRGFDISARTVVQKAVKNLPDAWVSPILKKVTELQTTAPLRGNGLGFHRAGPGHDVVDSISLVNKRGSVDIISTTISVSDKEARPPRNLPQVRRCGSPISPAMITRLRQQLVQAGAQGVIHDESDIYHHVGKSIYAELWKGELAKHGLSMLPRWLSASTRFGGIYCASKGNMWQGVSIQDPDVAHFTLNKGSLFYDPYSDAHKSVYRQWKKLAGDNPSNWMAVYQNELGQTLEKKLYDRFGYDVPTDPRFFIDLGLAGLLEKDRLDRGYKIYLLLNPFAVKDAAFNAP